MMFKVAGYHVSGNKSSWKSIKKNHVYLNKVLPMWLEADGNCNLVKNYPQEEIKKICNIIDENCITPVLSNFLMNSGESNKLVNNPVEWPFLMEKAIDFLNNFGFKGLNLDLEGVKKRNKKEYLNFVKFFSSCLLNNGISPELSIPAKVGENGSAWSGAYDYSVLGKITDSIIIMAYDYHWVNGPPGSISPYYWIRDVVDFAIMNISPDKLFIALPFYGYDWAVETDESARGLSYSQVMSIKEKYNSCVEWDQKARSPYFVYNKKGIEHEVWFENVKSLGIKIELIKEYDLPGVVFWRMGLEPSDIWDVIDGSEKN